MQVRRIAGRNSPHMSRTSAFLVVALGTIALAAVPVRAAPTTPAGHQGHAATVTTVDVGQVASLLYLPLYVADAKGFLAKRGVKMNFVTLPATNIPLASGSIDLAVGCSDCAFILATQGKPAPMIAIVQQHNALSLMTAPGVDAPKTPYPRNVRALVTSKGISVGSTSRSGGAEVFLQGVFGGAGLEEGPDFTIVSLGSGANIVASLLAKRVDTAMLFPPFAGLAAAQGAKYVIQEARGEGPSEIVARYGAGLQANGEWLAQNRAVAKSIVAALIDAMRYMRVKRNRSELVPIATKYTGITDAASIRASLDDVIRLASPEATCGRLSVQGKLLLKVGTISGVIPGCNDLIARGIIPKKSPFARKSRR